MATRKPKALGKPKPVDRVGPKADKPKPDDELLEQARRRFELAMDAYGETRNLQRADIRFLNGSADNRWQWPDDQWNARELDKRPRLTINKLPLHQAQVVNDARQNRPSIKIRP